ncbi:MAG: CDP-glycerol glycerophosphotransferase family protein [Pseudomonadota bacterium]|nr:CDP-glycerol glycerophosphotransferase family protein [Pseudomonadota bacterium]
MESGTPDTAATLRRLQDKVELLDSLLRRMTEQTVALSQHVLERAKMDEARAKRDDVRMAMLEAQRVVQMLSRASHFYPKSRTVVFVGRSYFGDNIKYAYLAFREIAESHNIRCLFLPYDGPQYEQLTAAGLACLHPEVSRWSQEDAKLLLGAAVAVICDNFHAHSGLSPIPFALLQGARTVQLWHGIPLKEIGLQHIFSPGGNHTLLSELLGSCGHFDAFVGPGASTEAEWRRWFAFDRYAPLGYPRNDVLVREATAADLLNVDQESYRLVREARREKRPVIIYGPTFRDHMGPDWFEPSGVIGVAMQCRAQGYEFLINLHPFEQGAVPELRLRYPQLRFMQPDTDIYPVLKYADVFVTDYSSLAFDILHADCPLVFYRPDHAAYMKHARAMLPGREDYTPGDVVHDPEGLTTAIGRAVLAAGHPQGDPFREARHALRRKLFEDHDGAAGRRVGELIKQQIDLAERAASAKTFEG